MKFEGKSNKLNVSKSYYLRLRNCPKEGAVTELTSKTHYISFEEEASPLDDVSKDISLKDGHISSTVHHCGDDLYSAKLYVLAEETFKTECVVKGPKKDFTIVSKYVHVPAA
eukprot:jgi/Bigna1/61855/fgenesh1_kg.27_\